MIDSLEELRPHDTFRGTFTEATRLELHQRRQALGLSYCARSRFLGVHWSTIRKWEVGKIHHCSEHFRRRVAKFLRGELDADIHAALGDPRIGTYIKPVSAQAMACVQRFANCYHLLDARPDLRSVLLDAAYQATSDALRALKNPQR